MELSRARSGFKFRDSEELCLALSKGVVELTSLNDFLEASLPRVARLLGATRIALIDYHEHTDHFDLLYFDGYPPESRFALQRRFGQLDVRRAIRERLPYRPAGLENTLCIPLYFQDVLEAVCIAESDGLPELQERHLEVCSVVSSLLGLLMSSTRLEVNRELLLHSEDLRKARQIQINYLPREYPMLGRCEVYGLNTSSSLVGGDYLDFFQPRENSSQFVLADACGHGLAAALIMSNFRGLLRSQLSRSADLNGLFDSLNNLIHFDEESIQYLTGVFLHFDEPNGELVYHNAGHYEPIVISDRAQVRLLPGGGPPLGMFKGAKYRLQEARLEPGDLVALYTDGLVDVQSAGGEYFGTEGITRAVVEKLARPLPEIAEGVVAAARNFADKGSFEDDCTVLLVRVN